MEDATKGESLTPPGTARRDPAACCPPEEQAACCAPHEKEDCCRATPTRSACRC